MEVLVLDTGPSSEAFWRDIPKATVQFLETAQFAPETHLEDVAAAMRTLLAEIR